LFLAGVENLDASKKELCRPDGVPMAIGNGMQILCGDIV